MRRGALPLLALLLITVGTVLAVAPKEPARQFIMPSSVNHRQAAWPSGQVRQDTVWFGGLGDDGLAVEGGTWDFDTNLHGDPFQGWTSIDWTAAWGVRFGRVTAADFVDDPYVPLFPGSVGQLWCGIHEAEALELDFVDGMGYGDWMCQRGFSPVCLYVGGDVGISFKYFTHSETGFDKTYIYLHCYDDGQLLDEHPAGNLEGISPGGDSLGAYNWEHPQTFEATVASGALPAGTDAIQLEIRFISDQSWSDQDGDWPTPAGPLGVDDVEVTIDGAVAGYHDFEVDEEGWTFSICTGIPHPDPGHPGVYGVGSYMGIVPETVYSDWLTQSGLFCPCGLEGNALECIDEEDSPYTPPGHPVMHNEAMISNVISRDQLQYPASEYQETLIKLDCFANLVHSSATFWRPGCQIYPVTTDQNATPHWSSWRLGPYFWGGGQVCESQVWSLWDVGASSFPCPPFWDSLRVVVEVYCSCEVFAVPDDVCNASPLEGETWGSPVFDNIRAGITGGASGPPISFCMTAGLGDFVDGFGQNFTDYLEPGDVGNANPSCAASNLIHYPDRNAWHRDITRIDGPEVWPDHPEGRWLCELRVHVARNGARQDMIPGYHAWKSRLAGDPEAGFVACLMDSAETDLGPRPNIFTTHFHEDDPGFDPAHEDLTEAQEILPDGIWTPGTRIEYYYASFWYEDYPNPQPAEIYRFPQDAECWEFEILPSMELNLATPEEYDVVWPCVLVVDATHQPPMRGVGQSFDLLFDQLGIKYDRFDYTVQTQGYSCPFARTFGGTHYNPGGWGNNGCTLDQLLGYRLIWVEAGAEKGFSGGVWPQDLEMYDDWLSDTMLGTDYRKAIIFSGDDIASYMAGFSPLFASNVLGYEVDATSYRDLNNDWEYCVEVAASAGAKFQVTAPGVRLWGNGCQPVRDFDVLDITGMANTTGNLDYCNYTGNPSAHEDYVSYAQIVTENDQPGVADWRAVISGFGSDALSEIGCVSGEDCARDSACVVRGIADLYGPAIAWLAEGGDPFDPWLAPYNLVGAEEDLARLDGPIDYLYPCRPNPFSQRGTIRFSLASAGRVGVSVFDASGRVIKTLADGVMEAGENTLVWDGTNNAGHRVGAGVFWIQLRTRDGYVSSKKMLALR
jgi:hypothetical protein